MSGDTQAGLVTIQLVAATALSLVVFVGLANLVVDLYARGVARAALDEAARAGAPVDASTADCAARAHEVLAALLGGGLGRGVRVACRELRGAMHARATVVLASWLPGIPAWSFSLEGQVAKERDP